MKRLIILLPIILVLLIGISTGYDLSWYTIDGGGATFSIGGSYS